jgi:hypothetical protein
LNCIPTVICGYLKESELIIPFVIHFKEEDWLNKSFGIHDRRIIQRIAMEPMIENSINNRAFGRNILIIILGKVLRSEISTALLLKCFFQHHNNRKIWTTCISRLHKANAKYRLLEIMFILFSHHTRMLPRYFSQLLADDQMNFAIKAISSVDSYP